MMVDARAWQSYGASVPDLQKFATLVLSQPSSASICERINGEFAFVKDPRRNRLRHEKAAKLVGLFHNLRLIFRMKKPNYVETAVGWNDEDKQTGLSKYGVTNYEPAAIKRIPMPIRPPVPLFEPEEPANDDGGWYFPRSDRDDELLCGHCDLNQPPLLTGQ